MRSYLVVIFHVRPQYVKEGVARLTQQRGQDSPVGSNRLAFLHIRFSKRDRRHDEQIHRGDDVGMVMKERLPALRRWATSFDHILGHARLSDVDAELEQLSVDPRRSP